MPDTVSKEINNVRLYADFIISTTREPLWDSSADQSATQALNIATGFGRIARWLTDLGELAFKNDGDLGTAAFKNEGYFARNIHQHALDGSDFTGKLPVSSINGLGTAATVNTESTLTAGSKLPTGSAIATYVSEQLGALGNILTFKGVVSDVSSLPSSGNNIGDVYFVGDETIGTDDFEEYVWSNVSKTSTPSYDWERFGTVGTNVDLSDYLTDIGFSQDTTTSELKLKVTKTYNKGEAEPVANFSLEHATTTRYGVTMLSSSTSSTSTALAATPYAVKLAYDQAKVYNSTVKTSGDGNAITEVKITAGQIDVTYGSTFLTAHPTIPTTPDTTETPAQLSHGGTFTAITSVTRDANGHVTTLKTATYTLPPSDNTDKYVNMSKRVGLLKTYLLGTITAPDSSGGIKSVTSVVDTGVYLDTTGYGKLCATTFLGELAGTISNGTIAYTQSAGTKNDSIATTKFVHQDAICNGDGVGSNTTEVIINCIPD